MGKMHKDMLEPAISPFRQIPYRLGDQDAGQHAEEADQDAEHHAEEADQDAEQDAEEANQDAEQQLRDLHAAREFARELLLNPQWKELADEWVHQCEENYLTNVGSLYPTEQSYPTRETYRYLRLHSLYPGASFASELLRENAREPLDLSKVNTSRICQ